MRASSLRDWKRSARQPMAEWLVHGEAPGAFGIDEDLESRSADASKATVRYARHNLDGKENRDHIASDKTGLTWNDNVSFVLTEGSQIKRVTCLDILRRESAPEAQGEIEQFEIDFALKTGELA